MELQRVMAEFIVYNTVEKCVSPLTISAFQSDLRGFVRHWSGLGLPTHMSACTTRLVRQCMTAMHQARKYKT